MNAWIEIVSHYVQNCKFAAVFLDAALKSFVVLALAGALCLGWRRASAATRHLIWLLAVVSLPCLPLLSSLLPPWHRPLWSVSTGFNSGNQFSLALELAPTAGAGFAGDPTPTSAAGAGTSRAGGIQAAGTQGLAAHFSTSWLVLGLVAWLGGVGLVLASLTAARLRLHRISRQARAPKSAQWPLLLQQLCEELRLGRPVTLLQSADPVMPMTWGWWRPVALLPAQADQWSADRRRVVLLHELAHVKRRDCLTQMLTRMVCALYWFNPLVWLADRRMCVEREQACDDLVLNGGCKASDYAGHLVEIARTFRRVPQAAAIPMARSSQLGNRVAAVVDPSRARRLRPATVLAVLIIVGGMISCVGRCKTETTHSGTYNSSSLRQQQLVRLEAFSAAKEKQSQTLAAAAGEQISPLFQRFFDAATRGDWQTVTNMYESFKERHPQYSKGGKNADLSLRTSYWQPVLEICLAYDHVVNCESEYTQMAIDGIVNSIPAGSIYFGGTDTGRGLPTAFCRSHVDADPFYTITQNALVDSTYLEYLRNTCGERSKLLNQFIKARRSDSELQSLDVQRHESEQTLFSLNAESPDDPGLKAAEEAVNNLQQRIDDRTKGIWGGLEAQADAQTSRPGKRSIYIPTGEDWQKCFQDYMEDARRRLENHQLKPGEDVKQDEGRVQVRGQVAVMEINGLLAKLIFDKNPERQCYLEESFPLDWMYPYLEPHGLIMKINRQPLPELSEETLRQDHEYWRGRVGGMIGDWLNDQTPVQAISDFAEKVFLRKDLGGFKGDPRFVQNDYAARSFSHWRSSIAGLYAWRAEHAASAADRARMTRAADFAFRQAFALCPYVPEVASRCTNFFKSQNRTADALLLAKTAERLRSELKLDAAQSAKHAAQAPKPPVFQMRLVLDAPSDDAERMTLVSENATGGQPHLETLYVQKQVLLDKAAVQSAKVASDPRGAPQIEIIFTDEGRKRFADVTRANLHKRLAIIIDGRIRCAPVIQTEISGGTAEISGSFTDQEAENLARKINDAIGK